VVNVKMDFKPLPNLNEEYVARTNVGVGSVTFNHFDGRMESDGVRFDR
jgi:hypothetical protein